MFQHDIEREFDLLLKRAVPFLIFAPPEMRNQLADLLQPLCHLYISGSAQVDEFNARRSVVEVVLESAERNEDRKLGTNTLHAVQSLLLRQKSIYAILQDHDMRLSKLERRGSVKTTRSPVAPLAVPDTQPTMNNAIHTSASISAVSASETTEVSPPSNVESIAKDSSIRNADRVVACLKSAGRGNGLTIKEISEKTGLTCAQVTRVTSDSRRAASKLSIKKIDSCLQERTNSLGVPRKHNISVYCWVGDE